MHAARLSGDLLEFLIEIDGVLLELGDVGIPVDGVHAAGRTPGRAAGEFAALDQQHVLPARLGEVIQHARADHSAADHHHPRIAVHGPSPREFTRWIPPTAPANLRPLCAYRSARSARSGTARWRYRRGPPGG